MTLEEKIKAVETVFLELDQQTTAFQQRSGLHCLSGCGRCCLKPDIEATILEFLPFAYHLYRNGLALIWRDKLDASETTICHILEPMGSSGYCGSYQQRGLICRLFGYSHRLNKHGRAELVTCSVIKTGQEADYTLAAAAITEGTMPSPSMRAYYMQLYAIDEELTRKFYPINVAIRKAIDEVLHYFAYREVG